jgi:hypothetical protein
VPRRSAAQRWRDSRGRGAAERQTLDDGRLAVGWSARQLQEHQFGGSIPRRAMARSAQTREMPTCAMEARPYVVVTCEHPGDSPPFQCPVHRFAKGRGSSVQLATRTSFAAFESPRHEVTGSARHPGQLPSLGTLHPTSLEAMTFRP